MTLAWLTRDQTVRINIPWLLSSNAAAQSLAIPFLRRHVDWLAQYFATLLRWLITQGRLDRFNSRFAPLMRFHDAPWY